MAATMIKILMQLSFNIRFNDWNFHKPYSLTILVQFVWGGPGRYIQMWQSKREISRECNDIIGSAKGSQISEKYWGEVGKRKRVDVYLEVRKRRGHIFYEWNKCLWIFGFEPTWSRLFQKRVVRTKLDIYILITCNHSLISW